MLRSDLNFSNISSHLSEVIKAFLSRRMKFVDSLRGKYNVIHIWRHDALSDLYRKVIYYNTGVCAHMSNINRHTKAVTCEKCMFKKRNKIIARLQQL